MNIKEESDIESEEVFDSLKRICKEVSMLIKLHLWLYVLSQLGNLDFGQGVQKNQAYCRVPPL